MDCWACLDKGIVRWNVKKSNGYLYEYMGRCDCKKGSEWDHLISASAILDPFEISEISKANKLAIEKMSAALATFEEKSNE